MSFRTTRRAVVVPSHRSPVEGLEVRRLLSGVAPVAKGDSYTTREDTPLTIYAGTNQLVIEDRSTWPLAAKGTFTDANGPFTSEISTTGNYIGVEFNWLKNPYYRINFAGPDGQPLAVGTYLNAERYPFQSAGRPGLTVGTNNTVYNKSGGQFTIHSVERDINNELTQFSASFEFLGNNSLDAAVYGTLKYHYAEPGTRWGVLANDTDAENDKLTATLVSGPAHGTLKFAADGTFRYTPAKDYNGPDSFTYVANDGTGRSTPTTVNLTVTPVNDAPTFDFDRPPGSFVTVNEDSGPQRLAGFATNISPGAANEANQKLRFYVQDNDSGLFSGFPAVDATTGDLTFTPAPGVSGTAIISVGLQDDGGTADGLDTSQWRQFYIKILPVNDVPVAADDSYSTPAGVAIDQTSAVPKTSLDLTGTGYVLNGELHGTPATGTFLSATSAAHNLVFLQYQGSASASDYWTVRIAAPTGKTLQVGTYGTARNSDATRAGLDITGGSRSGGPSTGTLTITAVRYDSAGNLINFAASFTYQSDSGTSRISGSVQYQHTPTAPGVLTNDADADGDQLKAVLVFGPANGTLSLRDDGTFKYVPAAGFQGVDAFSYRASDGSAQSEVKTVRITVGTPPISQTLQAETATLSGGTVKASNHTGYTGTGFADYGGTGSAVQWTLNGSAAGNAKLDLRYANGSTGNRPLTIFVNGVSVGTVACAPTGGWTTWKNVSLTAALKAGSNTIKAVAGAAGGANVDSLAVSPTGVTPPPVNPPVEPPVDPSPTTQTLHAETATLSGGTAKATNHAGYTGTGFADYGGNGSAVQWTLNWATAGNAKLDFRYANGSTGNRPLTIYVNGVSVGTIACAPTGGWTTWKNVSLTAALKAGGNTIKAVAGAASGANVDSLTVSSTSTTPTPPTPPTPPSPMTSTISGYAFNDSDKDGVLDTNESKASGKTVFLDTNNNGKLDGGEKSLVTDAGGNFSFTGLTAGTYSVRRVFPNGYTYSTPLRNIALGSGQVISGVTIGSKTV